MLTPIQTEANIAKNLLQLCQKRGLPTTFCEADVDEVLMDAEHNDMWKYNTIRRIRTWLHDVLYAPLGKG